jgi:uncharacterized pyridoxamine 5'-phosphate oxidase family protein
MHDYYGFEISKISKQSSNIKTPEIIEVTKPIKPIQQLLLFGGGIFGIRKPNWKFGVKKKEKLVCDIFKNIIYCAGVFSIVSFCFIFIDWWFRANIAFHADADLSLRKIEQNISLLAHKLEPVNFITKYKLIAFFLFFILSLSFSGIQKLKLNRKYEAVAKLISTVHLILLIACSITFFSGNTIANVKGSGSQINVQEKLSFFAASEQQLYKKVKVNTTIEVIIQVYKDSAITQALKDYSLTTDIASAYINDKLLKMLPSVNNLEKVKQDFVFKIAQVASSKINDPPGITGYNKFKEKYKDEYDLSDFSENDIKNRTDRYENALAEAAEKNQDARELFNELTAKGIENLKDGLGKLTGLNLSENVLAEVISKTLEPVISELSNRIFIYLKQSNATGKYLDEIRANINKIKARLKTIELLKFKQIITTARNSIKTILSKLNIEKQIWDNKVTRLNDKLFSRKAEFEKFIANTFNDKCQLIPKYAKDLSKAYEEDLNKITAENVIDELQQKIYTLDSYKTEIIKRIEVEHAEQLEKGGIYSEESVYRKVFKDLYREKVREEAQICPF